MWIRTQSNEIRKVDNVYIHNGFVISTYDGETVIELGRYTSEKRTNEVIDLFWNCLVNGGKTFHMPRY
ncbi:hypothetical protein AAK964_10390 [Tissierella praeacuta]|uniref:hypothetical protein n=1 Tax=Tissierella praeacuta TaxID=43131 RepID=UPI003516E497